MVVKHFCDVCEKFIPGSEVDKNTVLVNYGDRPVRDIEGDLIVSERLELCDACLGEFRRMLQFFRSNPVK